MRLRDNTKYFYYFTNTMVSDAALLLLVNTTLVKLFFHLSELCRQAPAKASSIIPRYLSTTPNKNLKICQ